MVSQNLNYRSPVFFMSEPKQEGSELTTLRQVKLPSRQEGTWLGNGQHGRNAALRGREGRLGQQERR